MIQETIKGVFGSITVAKNEATGNPTIYGLFDKNNVFVDRLRFQDGAPPANGFCVEDLIAIAKHRIQHLDTELPSDYNKLAVDALDEALKALEDRMAERKAQVE